MGACEEDDSNNSGEEHMGGQVGLDLREGVKEGDGA